MRFFNTNVCSVHFLSIQRFVVCAFCQYKSCSVCFFTTNVCNVRFLSLQKFVVCAFSSQMFVVFAFCHYKSCSVRFFTTKVCSVRFFAIAAALLFDIMHQLSFTSGKVVLLLQMSNLVIGSWGYSWWVDMI